MENPIKQVYRFNQQASLLSNGYSDFLESSFQIEEALEGFPSCNLTTLANYFDLAPVETVNGNIVQPNTPKSISRFIAIVAKGTEGTPYSELANISDVDRLDKACDAIVFALGSIFKLGLDDKQATRALNIVMRANLQKLEMPKDEHGKLTKPADFKGPEPELQALLDERK